MWGEPRPEAVDAANRGWSTSCIGGGRKCLLLLLSPSSSWPSQADETHGPKALSNGNICDILRVCPSKWRSLRYSLKTTPRTLFFPKKMFFPGEIFHFVLQISHFVLSFWDYWSRPSTSTRVSSGSDPSDSQHHNHHRGVMCVLRMFGCVRVCGVMDTNKWPSFEEQTMRILKWNMKSVKNEKKTFLVFCP